MSKTFKRYLSLAIAVVMLFALAACGTATTAPTATTGTAATEAPAEASTLVVGYSNFSQKFSPFFAKTAYDQDAANMTQLALIGNDRGGNLILNGIEGETIDYNGTDYLYTGIADTVITQNADGTVDYDITIRDDIVFSDGEPMTIDDVIFSMYVFSDPTYDGGVTFNGQPIEGLEEYHSSMAYLYKLILDAGEDNTDFANWTQEQQTEYWTAFWAAGTKFAQGIVDYCAANGLAADAKDVATAAGNWGYSGLAADATALDFFKLIFASYGSDLSAESGIDYESAGESISDLLAAELGDKADSYNALIALNDVANIAGIIRTGDYSLRIHTTEFSAATIYQLGIPVAPLHYYGDSSLYDYENNSFGFTKGDLSIVRSKTTTPMGAGAYKFVSYENGVITFEANENYWKGTPKTQYILFQETADADKVSGLASGNFDITDPSFSQETVDAIKEQYNTNHEITGDVITTSTVDNLGYGYLGISAENVNVGGDGASDASKDLRKAFATVFSVYRDTVINSYYGERASVIQYPISNTSWAAPKPADEGYEVAYSTDVDGKSIYTDSMTEDEKYTAALDAAVGFFKAAGYTWDDASKTFTAAPDGAALSYEVMIPGDGTGDHPAYGILTAAKEALATIGITLEINDLSNSADLWTTLEAGEGEMWAAAWQATIDPDMYQVYYSTNIVGLPGSTESNHYCIQDTELDELIVAARQSADQSYRKSTYKQCLDIILDWGVELPLYQRQNAVIFSTERVNMSTVTPDITTFWGWMNDIELIEMN